MIAIKKQEIKEFVTNELVITNVFGFFIGFLLTKTEFYGAFLPLAISYSLADVKKGGTLASVIGAFLGYIFLFDSVFGFLYAGILLVSVALFKLVKISNTVIIFGTYTFLGLISMFSNGFSVGMLLTLIATQAVCLSGFCLYKTAVKNDDLYKLFLVSTLILATANIDIFGILPIRIFCVFITLCTIYYIDIGKSAVVSLLFGACLDITLKTHVFTIGYSFATLISGVSKFTNKTLFSGSFLIIFALFAGFNTVSEFFIICLCEVLIACIIFVSLPLRYFGFFISKKQVVEVKKLTTTGILKDISEILIDTNHEKKSIDYTDLKYIFTMAEANVCKSCEKNEKCFGLDYEKTIDSMNFAMIKIVERGYASSVDFSEKFVSNCLNFTNFLSSLNQGISVTKQKNKTKSELCEQKKMMGEQYKALAEVLQVTNPPIINENYAYFERKIFEYIKNFNVLSRVLVFKNLNNLFFIELSVVKSEKILEFSDEVASAIGRILGKEIILFKTFIDNKHTRITFKEKVCHKVSFYSKNSSKGDKSGDICSSFTTKDDNFYSIIADGMGSGALANKESSSILGLLIKLLKADVTPLKATKVIEPLAKIKSDGENFVALDLLSINLATLDTCFVKYGAFTSYVLSGEKVLKIYAENLALGLDTSAFITRFKLKKGDMILMVSDGFSLSENKISEIFSDDPLQVCDMLFAYDKEKNDDKTAVLVVVDE